MGECPRCHKMTLIEAVEVEVCDDEDCGYAFSYRESPIGQQEP
jgi:hypothetical protein